MEKIEKILKKLDLIYYEYDNKSNLLILDKNWSNDSVYNELIKITYTLSSNNIKFYIDENKAIVMSDTDTLIHKIKRYFQSIMDNRKNSKMDIYILSEKKVKWAKNLPVFTRNSVSFLSKLPELNWLLLAIIILETDKKSNPLDANLSLSKTTRN